ncbi:hypothetical protein RD110_21095 [Rhodoferax koreense]|uniref:Uncharacterized protein n=1 Tax=Rhodoferax koreensis TaxID=1842727 RepID=A0A1P8K063_9BURK|nr:hypothetical protein [Rhodoferax koreense]APW39404.1 hypothetical protein RD110_21095 [Rhodoferax koreense]
MKYMKTESGQRAFKERDPALSTRLRAAFILIDGKRSLQEVLQATAGLGIAESDVAQLLTLGFIAEAEIAAPEPGPATPAPPSGPTTPQALYLRAYPVATQLTAGLGLRGFRLNLAVEQAAGYPQLVALLPRIREAVGPAKCRALEEALGV